MNVFEVRDRLIADYARYIKSFIAIGDSRIRQHVDHCLSEAVQANESPAPVFHTDPDRTFFVAEFPLHPDFAGDLPSEGPPQIAGKSEAQEAQVGLSKWHGLLEQLVKAGKIEKSGERRHAVYTRKH